MKSILVIWLGGGLGSVLRYLMQIGISRLFTVSFPAGTFIVNITGCFIIGVLYGIANRYSWLTIEWRLFLITGMCGGYTTFSSFSYEGITLFRQENYLYFFLYPVLSGVIGRLATLGGTYVVK